MLQVSHNYACLPDACVDAAATDCLLDAAASLPLCFLLPPRWSDQMLSKAELLPEAPRERYPGAFECGAMLERYILARSIYSSACFFLHIMSRAESASPCTHFSNQVSGLANCCCCCHTFEVSCSICLPYDSCCHKLLLTGVLAPTMARTLPVRAKVVNWPL